MSFTQRDEERVREQGESRTLSRFGTPGRFRRQFAYFAAGGGAAGVVVSGVGAVH